MGGKSCVCYVNSIWETRYDDAKVGDNGGETAISIGRGVEEGTKLVAALLAREIPSNVPSNIVR